MNKNDGGSAFPHSKGYDFKGERVVTDDPGMSLRDYFAGQAMASIILVDEYGDHQMELSVLAREAYRYADAMIEQSGK